MSNPRKPAVIRRAEGNRGHRPIPNEVRMPGKPEMPDYFGAEEKACWKFIVSAVPAGLLTRADTQCVERASVAWAMYRATSRQIASIGLLVETDEGPRRNPLLIIRRQASEDLARATADLGLSPLARTRLVEAEPEDDDPMAILLASWGNREAADRQH
jgi:P27 family predicted phage terminase small subunit